MCMYVIFHSEAKNTKGGSKLVRKCSLYKTFAIEPPYL